jgi:H+/Cl- antiporter ClcA
MTTAAESEAGPSLASQGFLVLLAFSAIVGLVVSLAAWGFLELVHQIQVGVFTGLPRDLGYDHGAPLWWPVPVLAIAGLLTATAIVRLPGEGGHEPSRGLSAGAMQPEYLPSVLLAAFATLGLGAVLGPEAPLIALGSGLGILAVRLARKGSGAEVEALMAAAGSFAAMSLIFASPLIAAVILIEASGLGGKKLTTMLVPGLLAAGIGSLVSTGMGSWTGLSSSAYALDALPLPHFARPSAADIGWTLLLGVAIAIVGFAVMRLGAFLLSFVKERRWLLTPVAGLAVAGLAIAFDQTTSKQASEVLFSGQDSLPQLVGQAGTWSLSALALLVVFKGLAWSASLSAFRGGPTFPALFLGAAGGVMASRLPGFDLTPAVAAGMGAGTAAILRLPLTGAVLGVLLTAKSGDGSVPLVIVAVVAAYVTTVALSDRIQSPRRRRGVMLATPTDTTVTR